jgi:hypothetical protein
VSFYTIYLPGMNQLLKTTAFAIVLNIIPLTTWCQPKVTRTIFHGDFTMLSNVDFNLYGIFSDPENLLFDTNYPIASLAAEMRSGKKSSIEVSAGAMWAQPTIMLISGRYLMYRRSIFEGIFWGPQIGISPHREMDVYNTIGILAGTQIPLSYQLTGRAILGIGIGGGSIGGVYFSAGFGVGWVR